MKKEKNITESKEYFDCIEKYIKYITENHFFKEIEKLPHDRVLRLSKNKFIPGTNKTITPKRVFNILNSLYKDKSTICLRASENFDYLENPVQYLVSKSIIDSLEYLMAKKNNTLKHYFTIETSGQRKSILFRGIPITKYPKKQEFERLDTCGKVLCIKYNHYAILTPKDNLLLDFKYSLYPLVLNNEFIAAAF